METNSGAYAGFALPSHLPAKKGCVIISDEISRSTWHAAH